MPAIISTTAENKGLRSRVRGKKMRSQIVIFIAKQHELYRINMSKQITGAPV
jgi:hypothetical protein